MNPLRCQLSFIFSLFILLILGTSSCSVEQEFHIKQNRSGTVTTKVDFTTMAELIADPESSESSSVLDSINFDDIRESLKENEGISNIKVDINSTKTIVTVSYDFRDIGSLNASIQGENDLIGGQGGGVPASFAVHKNKITYNAPIFPTVDLAELEQSEAMGGNLCTYKAVFRFEQTIKSSSNNDYMINSNRKIAERSAGFIDLMSKKEEFSTTFKLK